MRYLPDVTSLKFFSERCVGCGRCVEVCPHEVFDISGKKASVVDKDACMECGACVRNCAYGAIKVSAGVGCASAIINGMITGNKPSCGCGDDEANGCC